MLNKRIFVLVSLLLVSFLMVGCGTIIPSIGNDPPVITSAPVIDAEVGVVYTYDVDATDPDGDALTYSLTRNPSGMEIDEDTGVITWTPTAAGSFGVTVKVSDGVKSDTQSFTIIITPVAELTEIVVTPDTMALEVGGEAGTFIVTANYSFGEPQVVTTDENCAYTQPTTGVVEVTAGSVTAVKAGTDTIFISYTEGDIIATANISVTVSSVMIPMEITVNLPTFTVGDPYWFTVNMIANDDSGKNVVASFGWPISGEEVKIAGVLETDVESDVTFALTGDVFQSEAFTMEDTTTANFRGTFTSPGTYGTTIEVRTSPDDELLCAKGIDITVAPPVIGNSYGGGIVAYILQPGESNGVYDYNAAVQHGLIAALTDATSPMAWSNITDTSVGTTGTALGTGQANTTTIVGQADCSSGAAYYCDNLTVGEYNDWFLPSKDELDKLYDNRVVIGGFDTNVSYWSSSEDNALSAWYQNFGNGGQSDYYKSLTYRVRAVRAF